MTLYRRQGARPSPRKRNAKWLSEEALQIPVERREAKGKGEKERYSHLNAELHRIAKRDKKAFFSDQCKEIEENNRMGKTRDLFKKIRDTKGKFHAKMDIIKDRNDRDLTEAEEISSLFHSIISFYFFALITEEGFLISPCYSLELCIQMGMSFLFSFAFCFSSFHSYLYGLLGQPFCFFTFLFLGDGLASCLLYNVTNLRP